MMANIWYRGSVTVNPYHENAFKAIGMRRDVVAPDQVSQKVEERRQAVQAVPGVLKLAGRDLTQADITAARQVLFDPNRRMLEELLEHQPEAFPADELKRILSRLSAPGWPQEPPPIRSLAFLLRVVQDLVIQFAEELPPIEPPPYPVDTTPIPPFGPAEGPG
jgi:hypothetical protein